MRRIALIVVAAFVGWAAGATTAAFRAYAGGYSTAQIGPQETAVPLIPDAPYIDPVTKEEFYFCPSLNLYLGERLPTFTGKNATGVTGALGICATGMPCDTARATPVGLADPESTITTGLYQFQKRSAFADPCSSEVWLCKPDSTAPTRVAVLKFKSGADGCELPDSLNGLAVLAGPSDKLATYIKVGAGGSGVSYPFVVTITRHFRRP